MLGLEYLKILIFFLVSIFITTCIVYIPKLINKHNIFLKNTERPVECGSQSLGSGKNKIEIIFYKVLIIFIIFEVELLVLIPWFIKGSNVWLYHLIYVLVFIIILYIGYVYEFARKVFKF
jgi:NADH-quinone oxidoreductase subunit A